MSGDQRFADSTAWCSTCILCLHVLSIGKCLATLPLRFHILCGCVFQLFHLVGIVQILGNIITGPLSPSIFRQVRTAMVCRMLTGSKAGLTQPVFHPQIRMADILQAIEGRLSFTAGASQRLRDQVARLDRYMENSTSFSDAFIKAPNYFDFVANRNPVDLMSVPNLRPFDEASPSDATAPTTSPASTLQDLWPGLTTAASSNPITSATDLASAYSAVDSAAATSAAPLSSTGQAAGNPQTIQLPDSVLQPFTGDFSQNIFPQWYSLPIETPWYMIA